MVSQGASEDQLEVSSLHNALIEKLRELNCIQTPQVEAAFRAVPRHLFLPEVALDRVYSNDAILTKRLNGQVVSSSSQPSIMAIMLEQLDLKPGHRVLEIGAGTGYNAALMAHIVGETGRVVTIDIDEDIVAGARKTLLAVGFERVQVVCADGAFGHPEAAPYDRIILTVGASDIAPAWVESLNPDGRLVLPLEIKGPQKTVAFEWAGIHLESISIEDCGFMMLRGVMAKSPPSPFPLGPEPGLILSVDHQKTVDADAVYRLLTGPSKDYSVSVRATPWEGTFGGLGFWLALHEPNLCGLFAEGEIVDRDVVPYLYGNSGEWKRIWTIGLLEDDALCVLVKPPGQPFSDSSEPRDEFELFVRSFGSDDSLAKRLIDQVVTWDSIGRPSNQGLRIRAYPPDVGYAQLPNEYVVDKQWTRLVLNWQ